MAYHLRPSGQLPTLCLVCRYFFSYLPATAHNPKPLSLAKNICGLFPPTVGYTGGSQVATALIENFIEIKGNRKGGDGPALEKYNKPLSLHKEGCLLPIFFRIYDNSMLIFLATNRPCRDFCTHLFAIIQNFLELQSLHFLDLRNLPHQLFRHDPPPFSRGALPLSKGTVLPLFRPLSKKIHPKF